MDKHNVRKGVEIEFADGQTRVIFPLTIRSLRKFVPVLDKLSNTVDALSMSDEDITNMMDAAAIIMEKVDAQLANDREALEDAVDLVTFNIMMGVAMGASSPEE